MIQTNYTVTYNKAAAPGVYKMVLEGELPDPILPGQFLNFRLDKFQIRRPISVCDCEEGRLTVFYKVVGLGTDAMSQLGPGTVLDVLAGLGNGFDTSKSGSMPLLIGGGLGASPLFFLCRQLLREGKHPLVLLGFNTAEEIFLAREFAALGAQVDVFTADGSAGDRGFATDGMAGRDYSYFYTCGPMPMFAAVNAAARTSGQFSFEARMGCGFGACMSCSCKTRFGSKRVCKDGPVFEREEILW